MTKVFDCTLRDITYVMYNLNPNDEEEVACQIDRNTRRDHLAYNLLMSGGDTFAVRVGDQPIAVFGTAPLNRACLSVWAVGTARMPKALSAIGRHLVNVHLPAMVADGYSSMEARSHVNHTGAHAWLKFWGAEQHGGPFEFGTGREKFLLFRWTVDRLDRIRQGRRRAPQ